ncbi:rRNA methyltransferase [Actinoplanes ianthinogenes]|uniref:rRNA methyltransferase n=1 Tax=Actinoplanes ianthinogenes TaxID=122358 RepID=A0ABM7LNY1_9ACTN|nr:TrmH family RNA methyltransferase [Actinoplanes ianthinogenes]BCJ40955.1 rRNA methyltransferase [Actinoplanes ianthinogenes]GGR23955.1 rRNA methyltransferase [Actinoplanes ianthinogenes]
MTLAEFARARADRDLAVLEGFHALKHALRFGATVRHVAAVDPEQLERLAADLAPDLLGRFRELARPVPRDAFRQLSKNPVRTEVIAIAERPSVDVAAVLRASLPDPIVFLEDPRNLGNVGAVIRVAAAAGAAAVLTDGVSDPWDPAAIRGSAGLHYALPVARTDVAALTGRPLVALDPDGVEISPAAIPDRAVLAFGTERDGLSPALLERADVRVRIPMRPDVSSLNLATSVAITLYSRRWMTA